MKAKRFIFLLLSTLFLFSCANQGLDPNVSGGGQDTVSSDDNNVNDSSTPYATLEELEIISSDANNVHHKVARVMALQEAMSEEDYEGYELSKTPVIIYDVEGSPQYYEYRLKKGNTAYKSYAVPVRKQDGVGVTVKMDKPNDYSANGNMKVIGLLYPSRYGLVNSNTRESRSTQKYYLPSISKFLSFNELMEGIITDSDNRSGALEYENMYPESQKNYELQKQNNIDTYKNFEQEMQEVISMSSEEIEKILIDKKNKDISKNARWHTVRSATAYKVYKEIPNYWTTIRSFWRYLPHHTQRAGGKDKYGTWCGPVAFSMIMYGYHYKNDTNALRTDIKYNNDGSTIHYGKINATNYGRYFYPASDINWRDGLTSMAHHEFNKAFRMFGKSLQGGYGAVWANYTASKLLEHMQRGNPILLLYFIGGKVGWHWLISYKAIHEEERRGWWIFKWTYKHYKFLLTDNGAYTGSAGWWVSQDNLRITWMHPVNL